MDGPPTPIRRTRRQVSPRALPALLSAVTLLVRHASCCSRSPPRRPRRSRSLRRSTTPPATARPRLPPATSTATADSDIVTANTLGGSVRLLLRTTRGGFATSRPFATGDGPWSLAVADLNHDDAPDVVTANGGDGTVSVLLGDGAGGLGVRPTSPSAMLSGRTTRPSPWANSTGTPTLMSSWPTVRKPPCCSATAPAALPPRTASRPCEDSKDIAVGDFNADGDAGPRGRRRRLRLSRRRRRAARRRHGPVLAAGLPGHLSRARSWSPSGTWTETAAKTW